MTSDMTTYNAEHAEHAEMIESVVVQAFRPAVS